MSARRFKPYPAYKDSGVEWLGEIPAHWEVERWRYCCRVREGQVAPDDDRFRDRVMIAPNHIESGTGRILYTESAQEQGAISGKYVVKPGDIIYSKIRPALNKACLATGDWLCSADMYPVDVLTGRLLPRFLLSFILSEPFVRLMVDESMRVAMPKVNRETLADCPVIIPDLEEQRSIAAFLDRETARIDALVAKKERLIELLQEKRTALITRAVTKGLDPNVPMKDSGVEWLGEIPAHWEVKRLWHLTPWNRRIMYGIVLPGPNVEDGVPIVKGGDVSPDRLHLDRLNRTSHEIESAYVRSRLRAGDLVYAIRGSIGEVAMVPVDLEGANLTQDAARVSYTPATYGYWLLYALKSVGVFSQLEAGALGATIRGINIRDLKRAVIAVPPRAEQHSIASFLDRETAKLDALAAKVRDAIDRLRELRAALISAAVTGRIDVRGYAA
ncbi:MAG: restriction endonuclease subunit S [Candidatus Binatia bacterium]